MQSTLTVTDAPLLSPLWQGGNFKAFFQKFHKRAHHQIKKSTVLFNEGETLGKVFFIEQGFVKLYRLSPEGRETTIYLYGPGQILGVRALTSEDECTKHCAEALTDLEVISILRQDYCELLAEDPKYLFDLLNVFIDRLNYTERKLEGFITTDVTSRIAYFLVDIADRFCMGKYKNFDLPLPLTHQRIAEFVGTFRETVTVSLRKLQREDVLKDERGKITIIDLARLKEIAECSYKVKSQ